MQKSLALQSIFLPKNQTLSNNVILVLLGAFILSAATQINIPLQPIPLTFQSVTVVFLGFALGSRLGTSTIILYLIAGACGLPIFANMNSGLHAFAGPTAGYLISFLPAVFISGYLAERGFARSWIRSFLAGFLSTMIIFIGGVLYLSTLIGFHKAILLGFMPFIITEPLKLAALSFIAPKLWK